MSTFSLIQPTVFVHDQDMSGYLNQLNLKVEAAELDVTTFASGGYRQRIGGLRTVTMGSTGFWDSVPDASRFAALGVPDRVLTVSPQGAETNVAYICHGMDLTYEQFGQVGDPASFIFSGMSSNAQGLIRGQLASSKRTITTTGNIGQAVNLGLLGSGQYLYATVHCFSFGTALTVKVQSGTSSGSTPTVRITLPNITAVGGSWAVRLAGPIATDTWWAVNATTVTGSHSVAAAIGIGS